MRKKQQISIKELKEQVKLILNKKDFDFFDLRIQEQDSTHLDKIQDAGADALMDTLGPEFGRKAGDVISTTSKTVKTAQKSAIDWSADQLYQLAGPAPQELIDAVETVKKFSRQAEQVWLGIKRQANSTRRKLDRKIFFEGSDTRQAIFRVEPQNPENYPDLITVKQHFLLFSKFCGKNLDFSINNYSGAAPSFTDPGAFCLSKVADAVMQFWDSTGAGGASYRKAFINSSYGRPIKASQPGEKDVLSLIDEKVDEFLQLFNKYVNISLKEKSFVANLAIDEINCTLSNVKAKNEIKKIYQESPEIFHLGRNMAKKVKQLGTASRGPELPCILDCFPLLLRPIYLAASNGTGVISKEIAKDLSTKTMKLGLKDFLETEYNLKMLPKYIINNQSFKKSWFAFSHSKFYNPFNENSRERGFDHWAKKSEVFTKGKWEGKKGYDLLASIAYSMAEIGVVSKVSQSLIANTLRLTGAKGAATFTAGPTGLVAIALSLSAVMVVCFAWDPFGSYTKMDELKDNLNNLKKQFDELVKLYSQKCPDTNPCTLQIDKNKLETIKDEISSNGSEITQVLMSVLKTTTRYGIEDPSSSLEVKRQLINEVDSIIKWFASNTKKETLDWLPEKLNSQYANLFVDQAQKASVAMETLSNDLEGNKQATKKAVNLILPKFGSGGNLPFGVVPGLEASSRTGSLTDFISDEPSEKNIKIKKESRLVREAGGDLFFKKDTQSGKETLDIPGATPAMKELHLRMQSIFSKTFYASGDARNFQTAIGDLVKDTINNLLASKLERAIETNKQISKKISSKNWSQSSYFSYFDSWAERTFQGSWPSYKEIIKNGGRVRTSTFFEDRYRVSQLGLMSSQDHNLGFETLTILIGPSAGLYNTALFTGSSSSSFGLASRASSIMLYADENLPNKISVNPIKDSSENYFRPPKLAFLDNENAVNSEINLISQYNDFLLEAAKRIDGSSGGQRGIRQKGGGVKQVEIKQKIYNFVRLGNAYGELLKLLKNTMLNKDNGGINYDSWIQSLESFKQNSIKLNSLTPDQAGPRSSIHNKLANKLREDAVKIINIYNNYDRLMKVLADNQEQINFARLIKFLKQLGDKKSE